MTTGEMKMEDMIPLILDEFDRCGEFVFFPKGISMLPTIVQLKDKVKLARPENIKKYSIVLYRRANGLYVLHRIVKVCGDVYTMCGDNQTNYEQGIKKEQIIAIVSEIIKENGKVVSCDGAGNAIYGFCIRVYRFPKRIWLALKRRLYPLYKKIKRM